MAPNSFDYFPRKGDFVLVRHEQGGFTRNRPQLLLVWQVPEVRAVATTGNVRLIDANLIVPYQSSQYFLQSGLRRSIRDAHGADEAIAVFRREIDPEFYNRGNEFLDSQAYTLAGILHTNSTFFFRPAAGAVRNVLLGDTCVNLPCRSGFVAADHRAQMYVNYALSPAARQGDRQIVPMQCPACLPRDLVVDNENQILLALRLDLGARLSNAELEGLRSNERRLNDRRLEAGYDKVKFCTGVIWLSDGRDSGWISRRPGRSFEEMGLLGQANRVVEVTNEGAWNEERRDEASRSQEASNAIPGNVSSTHGAPDRGLTARTFGDFRQAVNNGTCCVCLEEGYSDSDKIVVLPCAHFFHEVCIRAWLAQHSSCPGCRRRIYP